MSAINNPSLEKLTLTAYKCLINSTLLTSLNFSLFPIITINWKATEFSKFVNLICNLHMNFKQF